MSAESILSTIGLSAGVGGAVSAFMNYLMTMKEFRKKSQSELIENRLGLYSYFIFHLDEMRLRGDALQELEGITNPQEVYAYSQGELDETIKTIDSAIQDKLYLLNYEILREWVYVKTLFSQPQVNPHIHRLRELLVNEYNNVILPSYTEIVGEGVQRIP